MSIATIHLIAVSFWFGLLATESVLELSARDADSVRFVAGVHRWIDILFEGPIVVLALVTGTVLLVQQWPASPLLLVKAGLGGTALIANLVCIQFVHARVKATDDKRVRVLTRRVKLTGRAIPLALVAFVMGLGFLP